MQPERCLSKWMLLSHGMCVYIIRCLWDEVVGLGWVMPPCLAYACRCVQSELVHDYFVIQVCRYKSTCVEGHM